MCVYTIAQNIVGRLRQKVGNVSKKQIARVLDEDELEEIAWRAGRGCHFEGGFLFASEYGKQVIQEDVPLLIAEIRKLRAAQLRRAVDAAPVSVVEK